MDNVITKNEYKLTIEHDDCVECPLQEFFWGVDDGIIISLCYLREYKTTAGIYRGKSLDINSFSDFDRQLDQFDSREEFKSWANEKGWKIMPLFAYIHSGVALFCETNKNACRFDSGMAGWVLYNPNLLRTKADYASDATDDDIKQHIIKLIEDTYTSYINGEIYQFTVEDTFNREIVDSCGGYYDYDDCLKDGEEALNKCKSKLFKFILVVETKNPNTDINIFTGNSYEDISDQINDYFQCEIELPNIDTTKMLTLTVGYKTYLIKWFEFENE